MTKRVWDKKNRKGSKVQTIMFDKDHYTLRQARKWLKDNDFKDLKVDETEEYYRFRQLDPSLFVKNSFRTINFTTTVKAVVGIPKARSKKKNPMKTSYIPKLQKLIYNDDFASVVQGLNLLGQVAEAPCDIYQTLDMYPACSPEDLERQVYKHIYDNYYPTVASNEYKGIFDGDYQAAQNGLYLYLWTLGELARLGDKNALQIKEIEVIRDGSYKPYGIGIHSLPDNIGELKGLIRLDLSDLEDITQLPDSIGDLENLKRLRLTLNFALGTLPSSIGNCKLLEEIIFHTCGIDELPSSMRNLTNLTKIDFHNCDLIFDEKTGFMKKSVVQVLASIPNLKELDIYVDETSLGVQPQYPTNIGNVNQVTNDERGTYRNNPHVRKNKGGIQMGILQHQTKRNKGRSQMKKYDLKSLYRNPINQLNQEQIDLIRSRLLYSPRFEDIERGIALVKKYCSTPDEVFQLVTKGESVPLDDDCFHFLFYKMQYQMEKTIGFIDYDFDYQTEGKQAQIGRPKESQHQYYLSFLCLSLTCYLASLNYPQAINQRKIEINHNQHGIPYIPEEIGILINLEKLKIFNSDKLKKLPLGLGNLKKLTYLDLHNNGLQVIPDYIGEFIQLEYMDLNGGYHGRKEDKISYIPESLGNLQNLKFLNLSNNNISDLPTHFSKLHSLGKLELANNSFVNLPEQMFGLNSLYYLDMHYNDIKEIPIGFAQLKSLFRFNFANNEISVFPSQIGSMTKLTAINISSNFLKVLPDSIGNLVNMGSFVVNDNQLTSLPNTIANWVDLTFLNIRNNNFTKYPSVLSSFNKQGLVTEIVSNPRKDTNFIQEAFEEMEEHGTEGAFTRYVADNYKGHNTPEKRKKVAQEIKRAYEKWVDGGKKGRRPHTLKTYRRAVFYLNLQKRSSLYKNEKKNPSSFMIILQDGNDPYAIVKNGKVVWKGKWEELPLVTHPKLKLIVEKDGFYDVNEDIFGLFPKKNPFGALKEALGAGARKLSKTAQRQAKEFSQTAKEVAKREKKILALQKEKVKIQKSFKNLQGCGKKLGISPEAIVDGDLWKQSIESLNQGVIDIEKEITKLKSQRNNPRHPIWVETIIEQLGGLKSLHGMLGVKEIYYDSTNNSVQFKIKNPDHSKPNIVSIMYLYPQNLYQMDFYKVDGRNDMHIGTYVDVYNNEIVPVIEQETQMYARYNPKKKK